MMVLDLPQYDLPTLGVVHRAMATCITLMREHGCSPLATAKAVVKYEEFCCIDAEAVAEMAEFAREHGTPAEIPSTGPLLNERLLARAIREALYE